jgi:S1-C subfamily serine protease
MRKLLVGVGVCALLACGFIFGLVLSGRLSSTDSPFAASQPQSTAARASLPATAGLPDLSPVAERALKVAANISSTQIVDNPVARWFYGNGPWATQESQSVGSGVIVSADGYVLTNNHVVQNVAADIRVTLPDGRDVKGKIVGVDEVTDLAVIKVDAQGLPTIPWGDSANLRVAEWVLAIGNPFQFSKTVTLGIVSAVSRAGTQVGTYNDLIQTDAAINPGNSGGALVNSRGELIGINSMIYSETGGYQGIGFAIPSNLARQIMTELINNGAVKWGAVSGVARWGTVGADEAKANGYGAFAGVFVRSIYQNSPVAQAGLRPGDIITGFNGQTVTSSEQLDGFIIHAPVGSNAKFDVVRDGKPLTISIPIVSRTQQTVRRGR